MSRESEIEGRNNAQRAMPRLAIFRRLPLTNTGDAREADARIVAIAPRLAGDWLVAERFGQPQRHANSLEIGSVQLLLQQNLARMTMCFSSDSLGGTGFSLCASSVIGRLQFKKLCVLSTTGH